MHSGRGTDTAVLRAHSANAKYTSKGAVPDTMGPGLPAATASCSNTKQEKKKKKKGKRKGQHNQDLKVNFVPAVPVSDASLLLLSASAVPISPIDIRCKR